MSATRAGLGTFVVFVLIAAGNAVTHGPLGGTFMEESLRLVAPTTPGAHTAIFLGLVWFLLAGATVYLVDRDRDPTVVRAAIAGALVGLLVDGSWNFINKAQWPAWSTTLIVVDILWHMAHGAVAGVVARAVLKRGTPGSAARAA